MSIAKHKRRDCPACGKQQALTTHEATQCSDCYRNRRHRSTQPDPDHPILPRGYESQWLEWQRFIGQARERYCGPSKRPVNIGRQKILIASDFHAPFHHQEYVAAMFEREKDADLLIVGGDLQDFYSVSRFTKYERVDFE